MREYEPIWIALKQHGKVSLTANRLLHPRIIKAVTKEKWQDLAFKLDIEPKIAILSHHANHSILTFVLDISYRLDFRTRPPLTDKDF